MQTALVPSESKNSSGAENKQAKGSSSKKERSSRPNDFFLETLTAGNISIDVTNINSTSGKKQQRKQKRGKKGSPVQSLQESLQAIKMAGQEASRSYSSVNSSQYEDVDVVRVEVESAIEEQQPGIFSRMHNALFGGSVPEEKMLGNMSSSSEPVTD